jgi:lysyl-tRNA synthetase class 1
MVQRAFREITEDEYTTRLIVFSDDYDAMRRIPDDILQGCPNRPGMEDDIGLPLTQVRDPGGYLSFGDRNNAKLIEFLGMIPGERPEFMSATEHYRGGFFNAALENVARNYDAIMDIMLPTLGAERRATYSPFLPISPKTGKILQVPVQVLGPPESGTIRFEDEDGVEHQRYVGHGNTKLQWKVDWAMRWGALGIDYEMCGKDLTDSYRESSKIARVLGHEPPVNMIYEMFLDEHGAKQSKSKGNGMSIEQWTHYGTLDSMSYTMFQTPTVAKKIHTAMIPRAQDDYYKSLATYYTQTPEQQRDNPVWHIHAGDPPRPMGGDISYGLLVNLAQITPGIDVVGLAGMLAQYRELDRSNAHEISILLPRVLRFCDWRRINGHSPQTRLPTEQENLAIDDLVDRLSGMADDLDGEAYQYEVYEVGKAHGFDPLRLWFQGLYEVLFGDSNGPRFGTFIAAIGRKEAIRLLEHVGLNSLYENNR